jgi:rSAM/selenodomain-associated transferase 1
VKRGWLVVFAKAPRAGSVKTRLTPPLAPADAAELYGCLLDDVLQESARAARQLGLEAILAVDPPAAARELALRAPAGFRALAQRGDDLGARMTRVAREAVAAGASCALLRGSDSPTLDGAALRDALGALGRADLVVRPDHDGGYGLVGLGRAALSRGLAGGLFSHPMSTPSALRDLLAGAGRLGLACAELAPGFDIDRYEDLRLLAAARHEDASIPCPRTLAWLDGRSLWPRAGPDRPGAPSLGARPAGKR